jgi:hypothetical protein
MRDEMTDLDRAEIKNRVQILNLITRLDMDLAVERIHDLSKFMQRIHVREGLKNAYRETEGRAQNGLRGF